MHSAKDEIGPTGPEVAQMEYREKIVRPRLRGRSAGLWIQRLVIFVCLSLCSTAPARAVDLDGIWTIDVVVCPNGRRVSLSDVPGLASLLMQIRGEWVQLQALAQGRPQQLNGRISELVHLQRGRRTPLFRVRGTIQVGFPNVQQYQFRAYVQAGQPRLLLTGLGSSPVCPRQPLYSFMRRR